jgi:sulfoxide reductase heme-binding subunit YedZ
MASSRTEAGGRNGVTAAQSLHLVLAMSGFASFVLLWLSVVGGFVLRRSWTPLRIKRTTIYGVHQIVALFGLCLGVFHGLAQLADPGRSITLLEVIVPFVNPDDPIGIGAGVLGLELILASTLSVLIQRRLGYARWRALHTIAYAAFMLIVAHVLISGSDVTSQWVWMPVLAAWLVTVVLWPPSLSWLDGLRHRIERREIAEPKREVAVRVDPRLCTRFGFCEHVAPDLFALVGSGELSYRQTVPVEQVELVLRAIEICPTRAITLDERGPTATPPRGDPGGREIGERRRNPEIPGVRRRKAISQW